MKQLHVALLQMAPHGADQRANLRKGTAYCKQAAAGGADIALFPEMWSIGYQGPDTKRRDGVAEWQSQAIDQRSRFVGHFRQLAKELNMAIAITYLQKWDGPPRNAVSLIDRRGEIVLTYAKVHTCDFFPMEASCTPGDGFHVSNLRTRVGSVKVGAMICYDREHPESARMLMLKGAELVLTPNACGLQDLRISQFRTRAWENAMCVAMTNYASPECNGHSVAFSADGKLVVEAGEQEGVFAASFDLDALRAYRAERTVWGNAFRRPHRYDELTSSDVAEPFVRKNAFGQPFERSER
ncbi:MAG: carbon-nitrogen hydrolase family protein [Chitinivibrionales bacterium]|nr:carbon-nitrogen hydrolase family protein [Chitinivibrionales bacterium]